MTYPESNSELLYFSTVKIEARWDSNRVSIGTGFVLAKNRERSEADLLVTNAHVVEGASDGTLRFTMRRDEAPAVGTPVDVPLSTLSTNWIRHSDQQLDIVAAPLEPVVDYAHRKGSEIYYQSFSPDLIPSEDDLDTTIDGVEEILTLGYPIGICDTSNLLPVVRRGITASPFPIDYEGRPQFLVDAPIFPGCSGSPVVICSSTPSSHRGKGLVLGGRIFLLGILTFVYQLGPGNTPESIAIPTQRPSGYELSRFAHLGIAYRSSVLLDFL